MKGSLGHIIKNLAEDEFADDEILYCCCSAFYRVAICQFPPHYKLPAVTCDLCGVKLKRTSCFQTAYFV